jgi:fructokinase
MNFKVIGIGEVLWDLLPSGPQLGGAPANFAFHARQLGADVQVITRVGKDAYGRKILQRFHEMSITSSVVQMDDRLPTGTAAVSLDGNGVPQFVISENVAWDALSLTDKAIGAVQSANAVCFGTLAQRSQAAADTIQQLVANCSFSSLRVVDLNLRQKFYTREVVEQSLEIANVVKLNELELVIVSQMFELRGSQSQRLEQLARQFELQIVALTRGENGSLLYQAGNWSDVPGIRTDIVDTVGAGDAFTAALVLGLLNKLSLENIHRIAVDIAGYVCSRAGATPVLPGHLRAAFASDCTSA